jgi:hypothetical protein
MPVEPYLAVRTLTVNVRVAVLALLSVAEQRTVVRPSLKIDPGLGMHVAGTAPSTASTAVTVNGTRTLCERRGARTVLATAPRSTGGVTSKSSPGTLSVPCHLSLPRYVGGP